MENYIDFSNELLELSRLLAGPADTLIDYDHLTAVLCRISGAAYGVLNIYSEDLHTIVLTSSQSLNN